MRTVCVRASVRFSRDTRSDRPYRYIELYTTGGTGNRAINSVTGASHLLMCWQYATKGVRFAICAFRMPMVTTSSYGSGHCKMSRTDLYRLAECSIWHVEDVPDRPQRPDMCSGFAFSQSQG
jgi:hypothetical protein